MQQATQNVVLQSAATVDGNGTPADTAGFDGAQIVEIVESGGGTCTVTLEGAFDGSAGATWYAVGYQRIDATAVPSRAVTGISVTGNTAHVYQVLDRFPRLRARVSSSSAETVTVRVYLCPVQ